MVVVALVGVSVGDTLCKGVRGREGVVYRLSFADSW